MSAAPPNRMWGAAESSSAWERILEEPALSECERSACDVADALAHPEYAPDRTPFGLSGGNAGLAIFYDQIHRVLGRSGDRTRRDDRWNAAVDQLASSNGATWGFYGGYTGVGWAASLLARNDAANAERDEVFEEIEEALIHRLHTMEPPCHYDLVRGFVGAGLFALERWPDPRAHAALERIVDLLELSAEASPGGIRWHTPSSLLLGWQRQNYPNGYSNLGVAHGIPAIWYLLAHAIPRNVRRATAERHLEGSVSWVLAQRIPDSEGLAFPNAIFDGPRTPSLLGWCYGDLGIAAVLLVIARSLGHTEWEREARSIARRAALLSIEQGRVRDMGLCHGAAGIGHVFNRMYQMTRDEVFRDSARMWLEEALRMRLPGGGIAGYAAWLSDSGRSDGTFRWVPRVGLLDGASGTALALLTAAGTVEPEWDRFLCISPTPIHSPMHFSSPHNVL